MPIQGKIISGQDNLEDAFAVRRAVFVEEKGIQLKWYLMIWMQMLFMLLFI
jgi:hypothetical protein